MSSADRQSCSVISKKGAFNHTEAIRSFQGALAHDPNCAMAYWGIAYANGPHVNKPMAKGENDQAWAALQKAVKLQPNASAKDQAYIIALAHRYLLFLQGQDIPQMYKAAALWLT
ncbi:MAG: hypothetical protein HYR94_04625 [Chloroflexi bacterium]|nr:hypothetical protein [Chloroflexota bacterium]